MSKVTVVYGQRNLVGIYRDSNLVATHDKFTKNNGDLNRAIDALIKQGHEVEETRGDFSKFDEIPETFEGPVEAVANEVKGKDRGVVTEAVKAKRPGRPKKVEGADVDEG